MRRVALVKAGRKEAQAIMRKGADKVRLDAEAEAFRMEARALLLSAAQFVSEEEVERYEWLVSVLGSE